MKDSKGAFSSRSFKLFFLAPSFLLYTMFMILPIALSVYYSLTNWKGAMPKKYIGLRNYIEIFTLPDYAIALSNTGIMTLFSFVLQLPAAMLLAYLVYRTRFGFKFFRAIYFLPVVVAPVAIATMFIIFYNSDFGPINQLLKAVGLGFLQRQWLSDPKIVLYSVIMSMIWQYVGFYFVILLAGMQSLPEEVFESSSIDGANSFQTFFKIVFPMLWDIIAICIILVVTGNLKSFDHIWTLTFGGPGSRSATLPVLMYQKTFYQGTNFGIGSTISTTILIYALLFTVFFNKISDKFSYDIK